MYIQIKDIQELDAEIAKKHYDFFITLAGGLVKSCKRITHSRRSKDWYRVTNHIDGTQQVINKKDIFDNRITNIGEAITKGAFFCETD